MDLAKDFLGQIDNLKDDVFKKEGLPNMLTKDKIRTVNLDKRLFSRRLDETES
jgi:hypothetical protein